MTRTVLIVDDDPVQCRLLEACVRRMGAVPCVRTGGRAAIELLLSPEADALSVVVLDLAMPDCGGLEVLAAMRGAGLDVPVIVQTSKAGIETVVEAMRAGAFDFMVKPASPEKLRTAVEGAVRARRSVPAASERTESVLRRKLAGNFASDAMRPVLAQASKAAASAIPVLIEGETGAGKEWLARAICADGPRARAPFVTVNCGALPTSLAESILFGHEKGAFTDATLRHPGKFVEADGGTLFLDEVGELAPDVQVKLLRALQEGEVDPVGARAPVRTDVRIIAATNRDLARDVESGRFREDLFYRLSVFPLRVPPLRERRPEIRKLAEKLLRRVSAREPGLEAKTLGPDALRLLEAADWPGNIRELENAVHRAVVLSSGPRLTAADFGPLAGSELPDMSRTAIAGPVERDAPAADVSGSRAGGRDGDHAGAASAPAGSGARIGPRIDIVDDAGHVRTIEAVEAELIAFALARYEGRLSTVARRIGIGRSTLYRKLRLYGLAAGDGRDA